MRLSRILLASIALVLRGDGRLTSSGSDFYSDEQPPKVFWMMSCGHVLCSDPGHERESPHFHGESNERISDTSFGKLVTS